MRILLISDFYPIFNDDGLSKNPLESFVQKWEEQGHDVRIIRPNCLLEKYLGKKTFYKSGFYGKVENINYILPFIGDIKKKIRTLFAPDIILAHSLNGIIFANKLGCKFSIALHASDIEILSNPLFKIYLKPQLKIACKKALHIACPTLVLKEKFLQMYPQYKKKTFVAPCGIEFEYINKKLWLEEEKSKIKVLMCGESVKQSSINAVIKTCENIERVELTLIGKKLKTPKNISNKVIFIENPSHKDFLQKLRESDIFLFPRKRETFGRIYLESMASGCLTICMKNDGIDGIIKDGFNGFLCENADETLVRVIDFPDKNWIINNGYETVINISDDKAATHYINCLVGNSSKI